MTGISTFLILNQLTSRLRDKICNSTIQEHPKTQQSDVKVITSVFWDMRSIIYIDNFENRYFPIELTECLFKNKLACVGIMEIPKACLFSETILIECTLYDIHNKEGFPEFQIRTKSSSLFLRCMTPNRMIWIGFSGVKILAHGSVLENCENVFCKSICNTSILCWSWEVWKNRFFEIIGKTIVLTTSMWKNPENELTKRIISGNYQNIEMAFETLVVPQDVYWRNEGETN